MTPITARRASAGSLVRTVIYGALFLFALGWSLTGIEVSPERVARGLPQAGSVLLEMFSPPNLSREFAAKVVTGIVQSVQIAALGTAIAAVLALPFGALAARNVAPSPAVQRLFRIFVVSVRGVPELVLAIVFVVVTGLGPVAGALALGIGAVGLLGKLVADSLEEVDPGVEQALRATGAGRWQVFFSATLPQAAPAFVGHLLYQLDVNIRSATLLGIVGAGGIGFHLQNAARVLEFGVVTTVMLLVFATVLLVELLAVWLRRVVR